jgi:tRNA/tmRNA/rRNA uracil-C5-methylase (TrmA/RlmC/RlmD family)
MKDTILFPPDSFEQVFTALVNRSGLAPLVPAGDECRDARRDLCRICHAARLSYQDEVQIKQAAFADFWKHLGPACPPGPLVPSPAGRHYRMVTKRKVYTHTHGLSLALIDTVRRRPFVPLACAIEPPEHAAIYAGLQKRLNAPGAEALAGELQYAIVRGNEREFAVILNVRNITPAMTRPANTLSKSLTRACPAVTSVFLFEGGAEDAYYLGGTDPIHPRRHRKLFGNAEIFQNTAGKNFLYSPFSFSQVNHAILPALLRAAEEFLEPRRDTALYDLYCGYGLFSLSLAARYARVTGIELSHPSIDSAINNAGRFRAANVRFVRSAIDGGTIGALVDRLAPGSHVILDPPRGGTAAGVVEQIAARRPGAVLHIFCHADIIAGELARWNSGGYRIDRCLPFDMFPGTPGIETMILLKPSA